MCELQPSVRAAWPQKKSHLTSLAILSFWLTETHACERVSGVGRLHASSTHKTSVAGFRERSSVFHATSYARCRMALVWYLPPSLPSGLLHRASSSVVRAWERGRSTYARFAFLQCSCQACIHRPVSTGTSEPSHNTYCLRPDMSMSRYTLSSRESRTWNVRCRQRVWSHKQHRRIVLDNHSGFREPCSPGGIFWAVVSRRPFMRFSRVRQCSR